jgi:hypothetical protein
MVAIGNGRVLPYGGSMPRGAELVIRAIPDPGEEFIAWVGTGLGSYSGSDTEATIVMNEAITQKAFFTETVAVTVDTSPTGKRIITSLARSPTLVEQAPLVTAFTGAKPNPFRGATELHFTLERSTASRLLIYNVAGRLVRRLLTGELPPGAHQIKWDGTSEGGDPLPTGVYFLRFEARDLFETRKLVLVREE